MEGREGDGRERAMDRRRRKKKQHVKNGRMEEGKTRKEKAGDTR